jgi:hypothetical protein
MIRYIEQLTEDLQAAHRKKGKPIPPRFEEGEDFTTMVQLTGIEPAAFPPVEKLSEPQLQKLTEAMNALIESHHYIINLPKKLPVGIAYQKLLSRWAADIPYFDSCLCATGWEFCDNPDSCDMREWCDWLFCETDPETIPVYNGIYADDGTKIDILDIPMPDLCLTCESFLDDDREENILCNLTRADKREEGEEFKCAAWKKSK